MVSLVPQSRAVPLLQVYIEGAVYDDSTQTWVFSDPNQPLRLWTIGNIAGPESQGTIYDVKLAVAYDSAFDGIGIDLVPSTTGGYGGFTDPSIPSDPSSPNTVTDGSRPLLGDGTTQLAPHGIYGAGTSWQEFELGDFSQSDSPIADFQPPAGSTDMSVLPVPGEVDEGQINVFEVQLTWDGEEIPELHFDLYNHYQAANDARGRVSEHYIKAPFSHDGNSTPTVPAGGSTLIFLGLGAGVVSFLRSRVSRIG